ncbi:Cytosolic copper metallochaperone [Sorochytrium milnesiophthora]
MPTYTYKVTMTCSGCSGAVERALKRLDGVKKADISLDTQLVKVETDLPQEKVFEAIQKTGKAVEVVST